MHERVLRLLTSGSLLSFAAVLAVLACGPRLGLPEAVTAKLADAIWWGLPVLVGGRSYRDVVEAKTKAPAAS